MTNVALRFLERKTPIPIRHFATLSVVLGASESFDDTFASLLSSVLSRISTPFPDRDDSPFQERLQLVPAALAHHVELERTAQEAVLSALPPPLPTIPAHPRAFLRAFLVSRMSDPPIKSAAKDDHGVAASSSDSFAFTTYFSSRSPSFMALSKRRYRFLATLSLVAHVVGASWVLSLLMRGDASWTESMKLVRRILGLDPHEHNEHTILHVWMSAIQARYIITDL